MRCIQPLALPSLRRRVIHLIDANRSFAIGTPQPECIEPRTQNHDLPHPSSDRGSQSIFRNPAARRREQTPDARHGVCIRKLQHLRFVFTQNLHRKRVTENGPMIEHLMSRPLAGDHQRCAAGLITLHRARISVLSAIGFRPGSLPAAAPRPIATRRESARATSRPATN